MISIKTMIGLITIILFVFAGLAVMKNDDANISDQPENADIEVEINGLHCSMCVRNAEGALNNLDSVERSEVKLDEGLALINIKEDQPVTKEQIIGAIESAGFEAGEFRTFPENDQQNQE